MNTRLGLLDLVVNMDQLSVYLQKVTSGESSIYPKSRDWEGIVSENVWLSKMVLREVYCHGGPLPLYLPARRPLFSL